MRLLDSLSRLFYTTRVVVSSEAKQVRKFAGRYNRSFSLKKPPGFDLFCSGR
jgi:hypothetical protein